MAKTVYARSVGGNWSNNATWSTSSGGAADTTYPVATDTAIFDANSGSVTVDAASACAIVTMTDYGADKTFTMNNTLTTTGAVTLPTAATTFAGTSDWIMTTTCTITPNSKTLPGGLQFKGTSQTYTISGTALGVNGLVDVQATTGCTLTGQSINCNGGLWIGRATSGTCVLNVKGGTLKGYNSAQLSNTVNLDGDVTIPGGAWFSYKTGTLTYLSGTITCTGGLEICGDCTLDTDGVTWGAVTVIAAATITLNSLFTSNGTFTLANAAVTFAGTDGFSVATLTNAALTSARTYTFANTKTYTVTDSLNLVSASFSNCPTLSSDHASNKAIFTLSYGASQSNTATKATRLDSSLGQAIYTGGTITTCFGWTNSITAGSVVVSGGETVAVAGVTKDKNGDALGSCTCYLMRDNGNNTATFLQYQASNATTGAYSFSVPAGSTYFVVAFKAGATPVMDVTDRTLTAA